jgi:hypothetical protein
MRVDSDQGEPIHLHARTTGPLPHIEGARVAIRLDRSQAYVYPSDDQPEPEPMPEEIQAPPPSLGSFC